MLESQPAGSFRPGRQLKQSSWTLGSRATEGRAASARARVFLTPPLLVSLAAAVALGGCATRADFELLKDDVGEMRAHIADLQVSVDGLKRKVDTASESAGPAGKQRQLEDRLRQAERKLAEIESQLAAGEMPGPVLPGEGGQPPVAPVRVPGSPAAGLAMPRELQSGTLPESYRRALQLLRDGQSDQAVQGFRDFLRANPKAPLAGNAQYWVGEAYFAQGDYNRSVIELNEVLLKYPQNERLPGALLALASAFEKQGDKLDAKLVLQKLISEYPKSEEAQVARQQLPSLGE